VDSGQRTVAAAPAAAAEALAQNNTTEKKPDNDMDFNKVGQQHYSFDRGSKIYVTK
jgi:hypothetical protein